MASIYIADLEDKLPISAHTFTNLSGHLNSAINPIFYGIFNPRIREGYLNLLRIITCKFRKTSRSSSTTNNLSTRNQANC